MAFDGNGNFVLIYNWANEKANGIPITASRMDGQEVDMATNGLSLCMTRDGQSPPTGNIPFGGFKATGIGAATTLGDALSYGRAGTFTTLTASSGLLLGSGSVLGTVGGITQITPTTTASGSISANNLFFGASPTGTVTATYNGLYQGVQYSSTSDTSGGVSAIVGQAELVLQGVAGQVQGIYGIAKSSATGGAYAAGSLYGGRFQAQVSGTSTFTHAIGIKIDGPIINGNTAFVAGLYVQNMAANIGTGVAATSSALHFEGSGVTNAMTWGNGGSSLNSALYSSASGIFAWTGVKELAFTGTMTNTSGGHTAIGSVTAVLPSGATTASYSGGRHVVQYNFASNTTGSIIGIEGVAELFGQGGAAFVIGLNGIAQADAAGVYTAGTLIGARAAVIGTAAGTIPVGLGVRIETPSIAGTLSYSSGLYIATQAVSGGGTITAQNALHIEGSGIVNAISWGNGSSTVRANLYSDAANSLILNASSGLALNAPVTIGAGSFLKLGNAYVATPQVTSGYVIMKDSTGTDYKVLVAA